MAAVITFFTQQEQVLLFVAAGVLYMFVKAPPKWPTNKTANSIVFLQIGFWNYESSTLTKIAIFFGKAGAIDRFEKKKLVKRKFAKDDRRKVIIKPNIENIMALLVPLYKEFRNKSEKLTASFSNKEIKIIETYFLKAIEIMNETTNKLTDK